MQMTRISILPPFFIAAMPGATTASVVLLVTAIVVLMAPVASAGAAPGVDQPDDPGWFIDDVAVVEGPAAAVDVFVRWCHEGPARARVERVERRADTTSESLPDPFDVRR